MGSSAYARVHLRDVRLDDVDLYVRLRCDPVLTAGLGGPWPRQGIEDKVASDLALAASGEAIICVAVVQVAAKGDGKSGGGDHGAGSKGDDGVDAGHVCLWRSEHQGEPVDEIGWMVLAEHHGRGVARAAVTKLLARAEGVGGWGPVHAFPAVDNLASNALSRSLGFTLQGQDAVEFRGATFTSNHWLR